MKLFLFLILSFSVSLQAQVKPFKLTGKVTDENKQPLEFATVGLLETNYTTYTDAAGNFNLPLHTAPNTSITIKVTTIGKETQTRVLTVSELGITQLFIMRDLSLRLNNVTVTSTRKKSDISNSSVIFDRQMLDQMQAFSLADVLNNLPGRKSVATDLQYKQNITLRSAAAGGGGVQQNVNSMGVAIYIDGIRQSNDANMQNKNIGAFGAAGSVVINHSDPGISNPSYDTSLGGLDIRNIPVDNIESIEVVSGVVSAKYGELTDGAIFITRQAGKTDYSANVRLNGSSTNASLSKGFKLGKKAGALNMNINYLNSVQNPTDNLKNYQRFNGGLMWTTYFSKFIKNTFSADYSYKMDNAKEDPDDGTQERVYSKDRKASFTNRTTMQINKGWLNRINLGLSYDIGKQETYRQLYRNTAPQAIADKDTTGIYEGYYIPGNFLSVNHIIGQPYNASANLDFSGSARTGQLNHEFSYGASASLSGNSGTGVIADPTQPFTNIAGGYLSERPYDFDLAQDIINFGFYGEDRVKIKVFKRDLSLNAGLRYDLQNGAPSLQPRINASYQLNSRWALRAAFGIATKAPSMTYRYPGPTYFDVPILNIYNGFVNESLYLVYTQKVVHDNSDLKPSRSSQMEIGVSADYGFINSSLYGYIKRNRDGFNTSSTYQPLYLPEYTYTLVPGGKPVYQPTGNYKLYATIGSSEVNNNARSDNYGIEWYLSTRKIDQLQTSFNFNTSLSYSKSSDIGNKIQAAGVGYLQDSYKAWYGIYPAQNSKNLSVMTKLSSDTHLPKLGFIVSLSLDVYWRTYTETLGQSNTPTGYLDKNLNYFPITNFDANNPDYGYLLLAPDAASKLTDPPFVYTSLSLRVAKEIKNKVRISLSAYNFLDTEIKYYNPVSKTTKTYSSPVSVSAELSFKF